MKEREGATLGELLEYRGKWISVREYECRPEVPLVDLLKAAGMEGASCRAVPDPARRSVRLELRKGSRLLSVELDGGKAVAEEFEWREE